MNQVFCYEKIAALRQGAAHPVQIEVVKETGSTNVDLLSKLSHLQGPVLLLAEKQTAGRGRAGRVWHSAPGASLTFSLAWPFRLPLRALVGLPLAVGVAMAEALAVFGVQTRLKWPNDLLLEGEKLGGILIESAVNQREAGHNSWAVIGIGINLALDEALTREIDRPVASATGLMRLDQNKLAAVLLNALAEALAAFEREQFPGFMQRWNDLHAYAGQAVMILDQGKVLQEGMAVGVDALGRLLLETAAGQVAIMAGDISLRVKKG